MANKSIEFISCLDAAVLSRCDLINAATHREKSYEYALNSTGCWWEFGHEVFNNFDIWKTHPELLRYTQPVDKEANVCGLCPLKWHIIVSKIFKANSNVSLEIEDFLT